ncbi:sulfatase-like hydrolase/transferase [Feifania hominis]|uniref:Sulfatase-like hydrolase/transferase n=1 Tax=Feifania hominis TaxID=2763660 RepID=A0A926HV24_9FIRM|nr:sulfatase-like hydrolase/transferase [Feifania hominis]MBC8536555.1 sulfatase-like hydrolase/transferase [Feifania hominis]
MKPRQVIFIMTDSQRWDMVGCYGQNGLKTPNLDDLAREGVRYEQAYTTQPVCEPARAGIFVGNYPHECGAWANCAALADNAKTLGQRLRDNHACETAYIGKWHLDGGDYFGLGRAPDGWDPEWWYDMRNYLEELTPEQRVKSRKPETAREGIPEDFTFGHRVTDRAVDYIEKKRGEDYFLVVSYDEPHHPFLCPEPYASMYDDYDFPKNPAHFDNLEGKPVHQQVWAGDKRLRDPEALRVHRPDIFGCNTYIDYEIGRVLKAARENAPDAMIIYTSDHGDFLEEHCLLKKGAAAYDSITHIPLIIKRPGGLQNAVYREPVSHIDLSPTIMEYFGLPIPKLFSGRSMLKTTEDLSHHQRDYVFMEFGRFEVDHDTHGGFQPMRCVYDGHYKLVVNLLSTDELYDMREDPYETKNLIDCPETAAIRDRLHDVLLDWMNETRDPFRGYVWETRPWRRDARKPTWKYTGWTRQRENEEYEPRQLDYVNGLEMVEKSRPK